MTNRRRIARKFLAGFAAAAILSACGRKEAPTPPPAAAPRFAGVDRLVGLRVEDLTVIVFRAGIDADAWTSILRDTNALARNRLAMARARDRTDAASLADQENRIAENAELLARLGESSVFLMEWTLADENCEVTEARAVRCRPYRTDNPLNGGFPAPEGPFTWVIPDPVREDFKSPHLRLRLRFPGDADRPPYALELRLRFEAEDADGIRFSGDALPDPGSRFGAEPGEPFDPFGYAELRLSKR